jgi:hypothetical protein
VQGSIVTELHKLAARTARRTPAVLEACSSIDMHADSLVRHLTTQYVGTRRSLAEDRGSALACAVRARAWIR